MSFCASSSAESNVARTQGWNSDCLYWSVIHAGVPAISLLLGTALSCGRLTSSSPLRTGGRSTCSSLWSSLAIIHAVFPSALVLLRLAPLDFFTKPDMLDQFDAIVTTLAWSLALLLLHMERYRRIQYLSWNLSTFFLVSAITAALHAPVSFETFNHSTDLGVLIQESVFISQLFISSLLAVISLFAPDRRFELRGGLAPRHDAGMLNLQAPLLAAADQPAPELLSAYEFSKAEEDEDSDQDVDDSWPRQCKSSVVSNHNIRPYGTFASSHAASHDGLDITPEQRANCCSRLFFRWVFPLLQRGARRPLQMEDSPPVAMHDRCAPLIDLFQASFIARSSLAAAQQAKAGNPMIEEEVDQDEDEDEKPEGYAPLTEVTDSSQTKPRRLRPKFQASLFGALRDSFGWTFMAAGILKLLSDAAIFVGPLALNQIISFLSDSTLPLWRGVVLVGAMAFAAIFQSLCLHQYFHRCLHVGMNVRSALTAAVYAKSLRLSRAERQERSSGQVVNLMSTDIAHLQEMLPYTHMLWSAPVQIGFALWGLWSQVGVALLAGLGVMVVLFPLTVWFTARVTDAQSDLMERRDARVKLSSEMVSHMQFVKMSAWETCFGDLIGRARQFELAALWRYGFFQMGQSLFWTGMPIMVSLATFACFALLGREELTPSRAFTALSLFNILQFPLSVLPYVISDVVQAVVSLRRLSSFLLAAELQLDNVTYHRSAAACRAGQTAVEIEQASYYWDDDMHQQALADITLSVPCGQHVCIVGRTGVGKSALMLAILGDLHKSCGTQSTRGRIAYCEQTAWIQNMTLRDNVLFGRGYDADRYRRVLDACALTLDLSSLPAGDMTEIGSNGINLSGGQRQRVSLARAVYADADLYLLDDPFSALDAHVSKHVIAHCLKGLLRTKTVVLISHSSMLLPQVDSIIIIESVNDNANAPTRVGRVREVGSHAQLCARGIDFENIFAPASNVQSTVAPRPSVALSIDSEQSSLPPSPPALDFGSASFKSDSLLLPRAISGTLLNAMDSESDVQPPVMTGREFLHSPRSVFVAPKSPTFESNAASPTVEYEPIEELKLAHQVNDHMFAADGKLSSDEVRSYGSVKWQVYSDYIQSAGGWLRAATPLLIVMSMSTAASIGTDRWLAYWSELGSDVTALTVTSWHMLNSATAHHMSALQNMFAVAPNHSVLGDSKPSTWFLLGVYAALGFGGLFLSFISLLILLNVTFAAATKFHDATLNALLRAPMAFFDITPLGRILNRLSQDINVVDEELPSNLSAYLEQALTVVGVIILICLVSPLLSVTIIPLCWFYMSVQDLYLSSSRELKRLVSVGRSPIYSHFAESLRGAATVRAFDSVSAFELQHCTMVDANQAPYFCSIAINRWLAIRLELVGNLITAATALLAVCNRGSISPALGALSISYTMRVTSMLNWMVRTASDFETNIVSVERLANLTEVPPEAPAVIDEHRPPTTWPSQGAIDVRNLNLRYRAELPLVLCDVSFCIRACEKVGIVGRTGSGKSSLMLALLRLVEPIESQCIFIDGIDIGSIGLADLRSRIAILPQDPCLFSGTLRFNLDPFGQCNDEQIRDALSRANLDDFVHSLSGQLDFVVTEGGANVSQGQRQQIALARAILRRPKIFLMDEGTSAVDTKTDTLIQSSIQQCFADATVLTIAHRIDTVMHCDRILVLDQGRVVEFDSPASLLSNPQSIFAGLVRSAKSTAEPVPPM